MRIAPDKNLVEGGWFLTIWAMAPDERPFRLFISSSLGIDPNCFARPTENIGDKLALLAGQAILKARIFSESKSLIASFQEKLISCEEFVSGREEDLDRSKVSLDRLLDLQ